MVPSHVRVNVSTSSTSMKCHDVADVDLATTTRRRHVVVHGRKHVTQTTTLSAEIALKYIDFNIKRVTKTPCGRAERLRKMCSLHKNVKTECQNNNTSYKRVVYCGVFTSLTPPTCHDVGDVVMATTTTTTRRHRVKKDNTSRKHYCQNDVSVCRNRVKRHI